VSLAVSAIVRQWLVPNIGGGRVPAGEVLRVGFGARRHIRKNVLHHLPQEITITRKGGSVTLEKSLARLVRAGAIARADALERAAHQDELGARLTQPGPTGPRHRQGGSSISGSRVELL